MTRHQLGATGVPLARNLLPILTIVFVGVLVSTLLAYFYTRQTVTNLALGYTQQSLRFLEREIDTKMDQAGFDLRLWSGEDVFRLALEDSYLGRSARKAAAGRMSSRVRNSPFDMIFLTDPDGKILVTDDSDHRSNFSVADRGYFQRAMAGKASFETIVKSRSSGLPVLVVAAPVKNFQGGIIGVLSAAIDIPGFALSALEGMQVGAPGSACILNQDGTVLASTMPGAIATVWPSDALELAKASADANTPRTLKRNGEARILMARNDTHNNWLLVTEADKAKLLRPAALLGWITGAVSLVTLLLVVFTLAGLQRALRILRSSEEKFAKLFVLSPDAIALLQLPELTVQDVNESFYKLFGFDAESARERSVAELGLFATGNDADQVVTALSGEEKIANLEFMARNANGETLNCVLSSQMVELGALNHVIAIIRDISELKRMNEVLLQSEKMLSLGGLAAGMAHEINNPLAGIIGYAQVVKKRIFGKSQKSIRVAQEHGVDLDKLRAYLNAREISQMLDGIHDSGARAAQIVTNMLSFSRKSEKEFAKHDLTLLLENTIELASNDYDLKKKYDFRKIRIVKAFAPQLPAVYCEAGEMQQVFLNLLKNGADAMADKEYDADSPCFTLRTMPAGDMVQVEIEDNGPGMDAELQRRIFEPFFTTKKVGTGTGLGLSVCYFIVTDQHRGTLDVQSVPGQWTRFIIRLPRIQDEHGDD